MEEDEYKNYFKEVPIEKTRIEDIKKIYRKCYRTKRECGEFQELNMNIGMGERQVYGADISEVSTWGGFFITGAKI